MSKYFFTYIKDIMIVLSKYDQFGHISLLIAIKRWFASYG